MKKISFFVLFAFFLHPLLSFGSNKDSNKVNPSVCLSINAGIGIPFGANSFYVYALPGPSINISASIPIHRSRFGIVGLLSFGSNGYSNNIAIYATQLTSLTKGNYYIYNAMTGVYYRIIHKNNSIEFRFLGGPLYFKTPGLIYTGESYSQSLLAPNDIGTWVVNEENSYSFAIDIGASKKWGFSKKFFGALNADFLYTGLNGGYFSTTQFTPTVSGHSYTSQYSYLYSSMSLINLSIGIGYSL